MKITGAVLALIGGIVGFFAAIITLFFGGIAAAIDSTATSVGHFGAWGFLFSVAVIISAAISFSKPRGAGIATAILAIVGALAGGTLVAICMVLAFIGGLLCLFSSKPKTIAVSAAGGPDSSRGATANSTLPNTPRSTGKTVAVVLGSIVGVLVLIAILGTVFSSKQSNPSGASADGDLAQASPSQLRPDGELAAIFELGGNSTDAQRDETMAKIKSQVVDWTLPVYDVKMDGDEFEVQTDSGDSNPFTSSGPGYVGTFVHITSSSQAERQQLLSLKTGSMIHFKGIIAGESMRSLVIEPAMLMTNGEAVQSLGNSVVQPEADVLAANSASSATHTASDEAPQPEPNALASNVGHAAPQASGNGSAADASSSGPDLLPASFDCKKAKLPTEIAICSDAMLSNSDGRLAVAYKRSLAYDQNAVEQQREWIRQRNACGSDIACISKSIDGRTAEVIAENIKQTGSWDDMVGMYPYQALQVRQLQTELQDMLGDKFQTFVDDINVAEQIKREGPFIVGQGCHAHECNTDAAVFVVNTANGFVYFGLDEDGKISTTDGTRPSPLQQWVLDNSTE